MYVCLQTDSFYAAMRLLVPQLEKQRAAYGIKEVYIAEGALNYKSLPEAEFCLPRTQVF